MNCSRWCLVGSLCLTVAAGATTLVPQSFEDLVQQADLVITGEVAAVTCGIDNARVFTYVRLEGVESVLKEPAPRTFTLRLSGGEQDGYHVGYAGMPAFTAGQRVLLFVHKNGRAMCPIVGWGQGIFVLAEEQGGQVVQRRDGSAVVGFDEVGNLLHGNPPATNNTRRGDPGVSDDGLPSTVLANPHRTRPALTLADFAARVRAVRARTGHRPEPPPSRPAQWIPVPDAPVAPGGGQP